MKDYYRHAQVWVERGWVWGEGESLPIVPTHTLFSDVPSAGACIIVLLDGLYPSKSIMRVGVSVSGGVRHFFIRCSRGGEVLEVGSEVGRVPWLEDELALSSCVPLYATHMSWVLCE